MVGGPGDTSSELCGGGPLKYAQPGSLSPTTGLVGWRVAVAAWG